MSVRRTVLDSAAFSGLGVFRLLLQFAVIPVLSRMLSHEDYGLVAMAMPFVFFAMLFADSGISLSLIRIPVANVHVWGTGFWFCVILGAGLTLIMAANSYLFAHLLSTPELMPILLGLSPVLFLQGLCSIPGALLQKAHRFRLIAAVEITAYLSAALVAVIAAWQGCGAWALVFQQLTLYSVRCVLTLYYARFTPSWVFRLRELHSHLALGKDILLMNIATFISRSLDSLVVGKCLGTAAAGVFSMAFQFGRLPMMIVSGPLQSVLYARLAQLSSDLVSVKAMFLFFTRGVALAVFPSMALLATCHEAFFDLLLSEKWKASGRIFMLTSPASALQSVTSLVATLLLVIGRPDLRLRATLEQAVIWLIALLIFVWNGLEVAAIAYTVVSILYVPRMLALSLPYLKCTHAEYWACLTPSTIIALGVAGIQHWIAPDMHPMAQLLIAGVLSIFGIGIGLAIQWQTFLRLTAECKPPQTDSGAEAPVSTA